MNRLLMLLIAAATMTTSPAAADDKHMNMAFAAAVAPACMYRVDVAKMQRQIGTSPSRRQEAANSFALAMSTFEQSNDQERERMCAHGRLLAMRHEIIQR